MKVVDPKLFTKSQEGTRDTVFFSLTFQDADLVKGIFLGISDIYPGLLQKSRTICNNNSQLVPVFFVQISPSICESPNTPLHFMKFLEQLFCRQSLNSFF